MRSEPVEPPSIPGHANHHRSWTNKTPPIHISSKLEQARKKKQPTSSSSSSSSPLLTAEVRLSLLTRATTSYCGPAATAVSRNKYYPPVETTPTVLSFHHTTGSRRSVSGKQPDDLMSDSSSPQLSSSARKGVPPVPTSANGTPPPAPPTARAVSQPLSREDIAKAIAQRYPQPQDQEKVTRFLQSQQEALWRAKKSASSPTTTTKNNNKSKSQQQQQQQKQQQQQQQQEGNTRPASKETPEPSKDAAKKSLAERFPKPGEREKVVRFLQSQQEALSWAAVEAGSASSSAVTKANAQKHVPPSKEEEEEKEEEQLPINKKQQQQLTREDVAKALVQRFPDPRDREKIVRFLQSQQEALNGTAEKSPPPVSSAATQQQQQQQQDGKVPTKELTREDVAKSLAERFPDEKDQQKIIRFLQSQQDALNGVDLKCPPPPQPVEKKQQRLKKELTREDVAQALTERFPDPKDQERIARFLQSQQDALNGEGVHCPLPPPPPPPPPQQQQQQQKQVGQERHSRPKKELTREDVAQALTERFPDPRDQERIVRFLQSQNDALKSDAGVKSPPRQEQRPQKKEPPRPKQPPVQETARSSTAGTLAASIAARPATADTMSEPSHPRSMNRPATTQHRQSNGWEATEGSSRSLVSSSFLRNSECEFHESVCQPVVPRRVVTCQCCFGEIDAGTPARCAFGKHQFCLDCIKRYVETWVYGEPYRLRDVPISEGASFKALPCLSDECEGGFLTHETVQRANTENIWESYQEKIFHIMSLTDAKARGSVVTHEGGIEDSGTKARRDSVHSVEEAMTEAKLRRCPDCHSPFLKESGYCNKIRCPNCRVAICYLCRQKVNRKGYDHFCVHSYDTCVQNCGKCVLWTNTDDQVDKERLRFVATNEANRLWGESLLDGSDDNMAVEVDVERLLQEPGAAATSTMSSDSGSDSGGRG